MELDNKKAQIQEKSKKIADTKEHIAMSKKFLAEQDKWIENDLAIKKRQIQLKTDNVEAESRKLQLLQI
jgi:hypothetical protein